MRHLVLFLFVIFAFNAFAQTLYVVDGGPAAKKVFSVNASTGGKTEIISGLTTPWGITLDSGENLIVATDWQLGTNVDIKKYSVTGTYIPFTYLSAGKRVIDIASRADGNLGMVDLILNKFYLVDKSNGSLMGTEKVLPTTTNPQGIAFDASNNIYVASNWYSKIIKSTNGGDNWTDFATGLTQAQEVIVVGDAVFASGSNKVIKLDLNGTAYAGFTTITGLSDVNGITVVGNTLYVATLDIIRTYNASTGASVNANFSTGYSDIRQMTSADVVLPLPVELTSFISTSAGNAITLNWATATEVENYGFEVERSVDNTTFTKVGFVTGSGNSNVQKQYSFVDGNLTAGTYYYRLKQVDTDGSFEYSSVVSSSVNETPATFSLEQNYPNPFNPSTKISFALAKDSDVKLTVFNTLGEEVAVLINSTLTAGTYSVDFNATNLTSGLYIYKIQAGEFSATKKMVLTK